MDPTQLGPLVQRLLVGPLSSAAGSALAMRESMEGGADMPANGVPLRQKASLRR